MKRLKIKIATFRKICFLILVFCCSQNLYPYGLEYWTWGGLHNIPAFHFDPRGLRL
jgi:hypothetical protein